ncbi:MAG: hypothetical protein ACRDYA_05905 [Egibacteraceae bacterium]
MLISILAHPGQPPAPHNLWVAWNPDRRSWPASSSPRGPTGVAKTGGQPACCAPGERPPALLTFARTPWYPGYATTTTPWRLEPLADQQLATCVFRCYGL